MTRTRTGYCMTSIRTGYCTKDDAWNEWLGQLLLSYFGFDDQNHSTTSQQWKVFRSRLNHSWPDEVEWGNKKNPLLGIVSIFRFELGNHFHMLNWDNSQLPLVIWAASRYLIDCFFLITSHKSWFLSKRRLAFLFSQHLQILAHCFWELNHFLPEQTVLLVSVTLY